MGLMARSSRSIKLITHGVQCVTDPDTIYTEISARLRDTDQVLYQVGQDLNSV